MRRSKPGFESKVSLPITPMLDMTFQLLFFFIATVNPNSTRDVEGQLDLALPSEEVKQAHKPEDVKKDAAPDKDPALDFPSDLTVQVRTQTDGINDGEISALSVRNIDGKVDPVEGGLAGLKTYLEGRRKDTTNQDNIKVQSDGKLKVRSLLRVMDVCRNAGFKNVSMVPPEEFNR
jgi:biopolymer transport protein ExbD